MIVIAVAAASPFAVVVAPVLALVPGPGPEPEPELEPEPVDGNGAVVRLGPAVELVVASLRPAFVLAFAAGNTCGFDPGYNPLAASRSPTELMWGAYWQDLDPECQCSAS